MPNQKPSVMLKQVPFLFPHAQPKLGISTHAFVCKNANHSNFFVCGKKRQAYEKNTGALEHFNCTGTASFPRHSSYKCSTFINAVSFIALSSTYCVPRRPSFFPLPALPKINRSALVMKPCTNLPLQNPLLRYRCKLEIPDCLSLDTQRLGTGNNLPGINYCLTTATLFRKDTSTALYH